MKVSYKYHILTVKPNVCIPIESSVNLSDRPLGSLATTKMILVTQLVVRDLSFQYRPYYYSIVCFMCVNLFIS